jgi:hypothetical protein
MLPGCKSFEEKQPTVTSTEERSCLEHDKHKSKLSHKQADKRSESSAQLEHVGDKKAGLPCEPPLKIGFVVQDGNLESQHTVTSNGSASLLGLNEVSPASGLESNTKPNLNPAATHVSNRTCNPSLSETRDFATSEVRAETMDRFAASEVRPADAPPSRGPIEARGPAPFRPGVGTSPSLLEGIFIPEDERARELPTLRTTKNKQGDAYLDIKPLLAAPFNNVEPPCLETDAARASSRSPGLTNETLPSPPRHDADQCSPPPPLDAYRASGVATVAAVTAALDYYDAPANLDPLNLRPTAAQISS